MSEVKKQAVKVSSNSTGYTGIAFCKKANMWIARKNFNQKSVGDKIIYCGSREEAEKEMERLLKN